MNPKDSDTKRAMKNYRTVRTLLLAGVILLAAVGARYIYYTWEQYSQLAKTNAAVFAESAKAFLPIDYVKELEANSNDLNKPEYISLKNSLEEMKSSDSSIKFTYLLAQHDGKMYFLADSEAPDSEDYSPPGQEYYEATKTDWQPFLEGKLIVTAPSTDRWGTWVSVLVPVKDPQTGEILAVLGTDYSADAWNTEISKQVFFASFIAACVLLLMISIYMIYDKNLSLKRIGYKLEASEELFRTVFAQAPLGIALVEEYKVLSMMNPMFGKILERSDEELAETNWVDLTHPDDLEEDKRKFEKFEAKEIDGYTMEKRYIKPDGSAVWVNMVVAGLHLNKEESRHHLCIIQDIQERKLAEEALLESERSKSVLLSNLPGMAYRCDFDHNWTMHFLSDGCYELTGYTPDSLLDNKERSYNDLICLEYRDSVWEGWERVIAAKGAFQYEYEILTSSGSRKWVYELGQGIYNRNGDIEALEGIVIDISEQKEREAQVLYIINHDYMTGLFNRKYFEDEKRNLDLEDSLPLSILVGDINGVRLINDAFGQAEGDRLITETAQILKNCCGDEYLLARTGGDEFGILMPNTNQQKASGMMQKIKQACEEYNLQAMDQVRKINLSLGYATKTSTTESIDDVTKQAEENMYKQKIFERKSYHSAILSSIMATMLAKSQETEHHAQRLSQFGIMIGKKMHLSQKNLDELQLLVMLHDIGKVGIDDSILNKPGKLSDEEWSIMKKHPEIGYRIAMTSPELESIAEFILAHHERWDGTGYPRGTKGEEIPLLSRILSVVDAYDAMTEDRVYRKALSKQEAIAEIENNIGTQFDPTIARIFLELIR